jgi:two-component system chemotaxis response regulator CheB
MICDDSLAIRAAISRMLEAEPDIKVVARAGNGQLAVEELKRRKIDVVVLDIEMPVIDGIAALPLLLQQDPHLRVVMASTLTTRGAGIAMQALRLGAADYVHKPSAQSADGDGVFKQELIAKIRGLARIRRQAAAPVPAQAVPMRAPSATRPKLLAIGSSTGGPQALFTLVKGLGTNINVPVVITQHMPPNFTKILADHITGLGAMNCAEAADGMKLLPGRIYIAPGDRHLLVQASTDGYVAKLSDRPAENFCRPAVDPMIRSATSACGGRVLVVMLTGMGQDGLAATRELVTMGGTAIAQDEASSVVWGMPGAIARAGLCQAVLPITSLASKIHELLGVANIR